MKHRIIFLAICLLGAVAAQASEELVIASTERLAATELAGYLGRLYPQERFVTAERLPAPGKAILVGSDAAVRAMIADAKLTTPQSFAVHVVQREGRDIGVIAGADPRGTLYGVYALLERLGCGFYLSGDALSPPRTERFSFDEWSLASAPLVGDRLVFNWHNFLSGCSTWDHGQSRALSRRP